MATERERASTVSPWRGAAIAGLAGSATITFATALLHTLRPQIAFPPIVLDQRLVGVTSGEIDSFFIGILGHWAQNLSLAGAAFGFAIQGAVIANLLPRRWRSQSVPWLVCFVPVWLASVLVYEPVPPNVGRFAFALITLPLYAIGGWVGHVLHGRLMAPPPVPAAATAPVVEVLGPRESPLEPLTSSELLSRRYFLGSVALGAAGATLGISGLGHDLFGSNDPGTEALVVPRLTRAIRPPPAPGDAAFRGIGLPTEVTPNGKFYVVDKDIVNPAIDHTTWRLSIKGLVRRPYNITYRELRGMPAVERFQTLECISNEVGGHLMSCAKWVGVPLPTLLERAGVDASAATVIFRAIGGYSESHTIDKAMDETTLIVIGMNGRQLPRDHGFPARLLTVGTYGMKNPKWLSEIEVSNAPYKGYWEQRGWSPSVDPRTMSRIDVPRSHAITTGDPVPLAGVAFAGSRGISKVEVSTDGGQRWQPAQLKTQLAPYTWAFWLYRWTPDRPGDVDVVVRAFDGDGRIQDERERSPFPSGSSGYDSIRLSITA